MSSSQQEVVVTQIDAKHLATLLLDSSSSNNTLRIIDVRDADHEGGNIIRSTNIPYFDEEKALELVNSIIQHNRDKIAQARTKDRSVHAKQMLTQLRNEIGITQKNILNGEDEMIQLVVFHCYYCRMRGPTAAKLFQQVLLREAENMTENVQQRKMIIPEVKFLKGGWSQWKKLYKNNEQLVENAKQLPKFIKAVRRE